MSEEMAYVLNDALKDDLAELCERYGVSELLMFGSGVREDFEPGRSDIDLLVAFRPGSRVGYLRLFELQGRLEHLFGREVHLVPKGGLNPVIRDEVLSEARSIYQNV
jgi:predicted nucleotidyltransferase